MDPEGTPAEPRRPERRPVTLNPFDSLRDRMERLPAYLWQGQVRQAFWKTGTLISLAVNIVLIALVLALGGHVFKLKRAVEPLTSGLQRGFEQMDRAAIRTAVQVQDEIPVAFDLPIRQQTVVTLTEPTQVEDALVTIRTASFGVFNAPAVVVLPAGTRLPIELDMAVPVAATVPVELDVPVNIKLADTGLHKPFVRLGRLISGYQNLVDTIPDCWGEFLLGTGCAEDEASPP